MLRDVEVHHCATVVGENHQNEQHLGPYGGYCNEIGRHQIPGMVSQKALPCRRRWLIGPYSVFVYGGFGNIDAEFPQFPDNPGGERQLGLATNILPISALTSSDTAGIPGLLCWLNIAQ
jgi:hypothetical protein